MTEIQHVLVFFAMEQGNYISFPSCTLHFSHNNERFTLIEAMPLIEKLQLQKVTTQIHPGEPMELFQGVGVIFLILTLLSLTAFDL
jgi:hypothetical protein